MFYIFHYLLWSFSRPLEIFMRKEKIVRKRNLAGENENEASNGGSLLLRLY